MGGDSGMAPSNIGGGSDFDKLKEKYAGFSHPQAYIELGGKMFGDKGKRMVVGDINIDLTSGFEAAMASFRIYNVYDHESGEFYFGDIKSQVVLGNVLSIQLGYLDTLESVFTGFVAGISFGFDPAGLPYIEVTGMDVKGVMMSGSYALQLSARSYGEAVQEILQKTAYDNMQGGDIILGLNISDTPDKKQGGADGESAETIEMVSESDYEFVVKAAKKFNYEFFTDRGIVYFRKSKSNEDILLELSVGKGLLQFEIGYSLTGMVETVEASSLDAGAGKVIFSKAKYSGKLSTGSKAKKLIKGSRHVYIDPSIMSQEHADARVASLMEEMEYRLGSLKCECVGLPELRPGRFISVSGLGVPVDNNFYITGVTHVFNEDGGYRTKLTGCAREIMA